MVGVGAIDRDVKAATESQHGPQVDLVAPGEGIVAACLESSTKVCETHGTSDATALASASAALIWSKHPCWTDNQVLRVMLNTASKPRSGKERTDHLGYGAVRPRIALTNPGEPGPADKYPLPDTAAAGSNSPSSDATASAGTAAPAKDDGSSSAASAHKENGTSWAVLGVGGAVLLGAAISVAAPRPAGDCQDMVPSEYRYSDALVADTDEAQDAVTLLCCSITRVLRSDCANRLAA